ncbi:hypothetical protein A6A29_32365 [Streptomyces sp. TSRI0281]|nr:hypothetical protein A6A29_32365 [Streptomyces sp. TSRI0281]
MVSETHRPDLAQELINRAAKASEHWRYLTCGQLSAEDIDRGCLADQANAVVVQRIIADHGWPGWSRVGKEGATAAWLVALRADHDLPFQRHAARLMHQAVRSGEASQLQWVSLHDRCLITSGDRQQYGTQYRLGPNGPERLAVRDPLTLDERRATVGLPPATVSLEALRRRRASEPRPDAAAEIPDDKSTAELVSTA